jgi:hypothetical protein
MLPEFTRAELTELARLEIEASRELRGPIWTLDPEDRGYVIRCLARAANYRTRAVRAR